jgi:hypothetical protein
MRNNRLAKLERTMNIHAGKPLTTDAEAHALLSSIPFEQFKAIFVEDPGCIDWGGRDWRSMSDPELAGFVFSAMPELLPIAQARMEGRDTRSVEDFDREIKEIEALISDLEKEEG